jgi:hypothetical protein
MDRSWTSEQLETKEAALRFARSELGGCCEGFSRERWRACARFGVLGLSFPTHMEAPIETYLQPS